MLGVDTITLTIASATTERIVSAVKISTAGSRRRLSRTSFRIVSKTAMFRTAFSREIDRNEMCSTWA
jgi:hypothetical protein